MFIKITTNRKGQGYYHLVESYRDQGKVKQRTLLSLGKVGEDRLDDLVTAISRHKDVLTALEAAIYCSPLRSSSFFRRKIEYKPKKGEIDETEKVG